MITSAASGGTRHSSWLDCARWIAALEVVYSHVWQLVFMSHTARMEHSWLVRVSAIFVKFAHPAVVVFFVLSGYLVGGTTLRAAIAGRLDLRTYAASRISRIYLVLIPALLIGAFLDVMGSHYLNTSGIYDYAGSVHAPSMSFDFRQGLNSKTFVGNLLLLNGIFVTNFGSNVPLWSLAYEWWYYVIFGLLMCAIMSRTRWHLKALCWALLAALTAILPIKILLWFSLWLIGMMLAWIEPIIVNTRHWLSMLFFVCVLFATAFGFSNFLDPETLLGSFSTDFLVSIAFSSAVLSRPRKSGRMAGINFFLANFSYSLYLLHFPLIVFLAALELRFLPALIYAHVAAVAALNFVVFMALTYVFSFVVAKATESHTTVIRNFLLRRVLTIKAAPPQQYVLK